MHKRYTRKDIKVGNYVCLDNKPWFMASYNRGEDRRTQGYMRDKLTPKSKVPYYKVTGTKPLTCLIKTKGWDFRDAFYLKWVTDVCANYNAVIERRTNA